MNPRSIYSTSTVLTAAVVSLLGGLLLLVAGCPTVGGNDGGTTNGDSGVTGKFVGAQTCMTCHGDNHNDWSGTKHATALEGLRSNAFAGDDCLECHSQDFRYQTELAAESGDSSKIPTIDTAVFSLECVTCHAPHGNSEESHQLRMP